MTPSDTTTTVKIYGRWTEWQRYEAGDARFESSPGPGKNRAFRDVCFKYAFSPVSVDTSLGWRRPTDNPLKADN